MSLYGGSPSARYLLATKTVYATKDAVRRKHTNFLELRKAEVGLRRIYRPRRWVNRGAEPGWEVGTSISRARPSLGYYAGVGLSVSWRTLGQLLRTP